MKTQNLNAKVAFNKSAVLDLDDKALANVNGGTFSSGIPIGIWLAEQINDFLEEEDC